MFIFDIFTSIPFNTEEIKGIKTQPANSDPCPEPFMQTAFLGHSNSSIRLMLLYEAYLSSFWMFFPIKCKKLAPYSLLETPLVPEYSGTSFYNTSNSPTFYAANTLAHTVLDRIAGPDLHRWYWKLRAGLVFTQSPSLQAVRKQDPLCLNPWAQMLAVFHQHSVLFVCFFVHLCIYARGLHSELSETDSFLLWVTALQWGCNFFFYFWHQFSSGRLIEIQQNKVIMTIL